MGAGGFCLRRVNKKSQNVAAVKKAPKEESLKLSSTALMKAQVTLEGMCSGTSHFKNIKCGGFYFCYFN